jgi:hypothetical protein
MPLHISRRDFFEHTVLAIAAGFASLVSLRADPATQLMTLQKNLMCRRRGCFEEVRDGCFPMALNTVLA